MFVSTQTPLSKQINFRNNFQSTIKKIVKTIMVTKVEHMGMGLSSKVKSNICHGSYFL